MLFYVDWSLSANLVRQHSRSVEGTSAKLLAERCDADTATVISQPPAGTRHL